MSNIGVLDFYQYICGQINNGQTVILVPWLFEIFLKTKAGPMFTNQQVSWELA